MGFFSTDAGQSAISSGIGSLLNIGTTLIGSKQQQDLIREQANTQKELMDKQLELAKINQATALAQLNGVTNPSNSSKSNLPLYIGLGVGGVLVLGLVIFAVTRNK